MEALARAKRLREEALTAQAARQAEGTACTVRNAERAKKHGMVEKSAGESGVAGNLKQKWLTFLESPSGKEIAARLWRLAFADKRSGRV